jgi:hypothetical protein
MLPNVTSPSAAPVASDPVLDALANAPDDDEPETEEERAAVEAARGDLRAGSGLYTHEEVREYWLDEP